jgi:hypothetical protein
MGVEMAYTPEIGQGLPAGITTGAALGVKVILNI